MPLTIGKIESGAGEAAATKSGLRSRNVSLLGVAVWLLLANFASAQAGDQFFRSNGVNIRYIVAGKGEPVILVHGFAGNLEVWRPLIADLSKDHQAIALDCRGHGKSDKPHEAEQFGIEMVNDIVRLMDHLQIKKAHVIGYSMGGAIVMKMLVEHPDRFLTAVIGGSTGYQEKDLEEQASLTKYLQSGMSFSEAVIAAAPPDAPPLSAEQREALKSQDPMHDSKALAAQRLGNKELIVNYESLKANQVPTLVIYGGNDHPERFADLKKALSNAEYEVIAGAGHAGAVESQEFVRDIHLFLQQHQQPSMTTAEHQISRPASLRMIAVCLAVKFSSQESLRRACQCCSPANALTLESWT
jgi:pimeloyl-ACP methyl ester carboxylesterase